MHCSSAFYLYSITLQISKPLTSKYVYVQDAKGKVMDKIDVLSQNVKISEKKLELYTDFHWNSDTKYTMVFEQGKHNTIRVCMSVIIFLFPRICKN